MVSQAESACRVLIQSDLSFPLTMEVNVPSAAMAEAIRKKLFIPCTNSVMATLSRMERPAKSASMVFGGSALAITVPRRASPIDCPKKRIVPSVPAATPKVTPPERTIRALWATIAMNHVEGIWFGEARRIQWRAHGEKTSV